MFVLKALSATDLSNAVDSKTMSRSSGCSTNVYRFDPIKGYIDTVTKCSGSQDAWYQRIKVSDWDLLVTEEDIEEWGVTADLAGWENIKREIPELANANVDIQVGCQCPAFLYWGSAYILDQLDAGEESLSRYKNTPAPEGRFPSERDPDLSRTLCKHLASALKRVF